MNAVLQILENRGLISAESVERFFDEREFRDVGDVQEELWAALAPEAADSKPSAVDPFNFVASASMRGDSGCGNPECRLHKVTLLARYAALYTDKTIVPLPLGTRHQNEFDIRYLLMGTVLCIQRLRPLVEAGIVTFVRQELPYCDVHLHAALPELLGTTKIALHLYSKNKARFKITVEPPEDEKDTWPSFTIRGPSDFLEHGRILTSLYEVPNWLDGWRDLKRKTPLSRTALDKSRLVEMIFKDIAMDVAIEQALGLRYDAKYLTNLPGEALVLSRLNEEDGYFEHCRNVLCAELAHTIPLLQDLPLSTVLKVRAGEREAFLQYRAAIGKIAGDYIRQRKNVGKREAREIYSDILLPEILKLNSEAKAVRRASLKRAAAKTLIAAGAVGIGVFGGFLPPQMAELVKAVGGISLLRELGEAFASIEKNPLQIRNNNFYFLLRLVQEAEH